MVPDTTIRHLGARHERAPCLAHRHAVLDLAVTDLIVGRLIDHRTATNHLYPLSSVDALRRRVGVVCRILSDGLLMIGDEVVELSAEAA